MILKRRISRLFRKQNSILKWNSRWKISKLRSSNHPSILKNVPPKKKKHFFKTSRKLQQQEQKKCGKHFFSTYPSPNYEIYGHVKKEKKTTKPTKKVLAAGGVRRSRRSDASSGAQAQVHPSRRGIYLPTAWLCLAKRAALARRTFARTHGFLFFEKARSGVARTRDLTLVRISIHACDPL